MKKKVVFFAMSIVPRVDKRIKEFIDKGYEVEVFSFGDAEKIIDIDTPYNVYVLDERYRIPYVKRLVIFTPKVMSKIKTYDKRNTIFYFFSLNVSIATLLLSKITFIYEESDMLFDRSKNRILRTILKSINKRIIKKSNITVFTSEGFAKYYYGDTIPANIVFITNRVNQECDSLLSIEKEPIDFNALKFGFVGYVRYYTLYNFAKVLVNKFPSFEFHFYGKNSIYTDEEVKILTDLGNVYFHGQFKNPNDLPLIFSKLDFVVATYDVRGVNPRYAEPNKIYESIYFRTPIVVSTNSFLADKVHRLGIGFSVDPLSEDDIVKQVSVLDKQRYDSYLYALNSIPKSEALNDNKLFFKKVDQL